MKRFVFVLVVLVTGCKKPVPLTSIEAEALATAEARRHPRPVHRGSAKPGRFGDQIATHSSELEAIREPLSKQVCTVGREPDEPCTAYLDATRPALETLLEATSREDGGFDPAQGALAPLVSNSVPGLLAVCKRADLEIDVKRQRKDPAGALRSCADALAWSRDVASNGMMTNVMIGVSCTDMTTPRCKAALVDARPEARHALATELAIVQKGQAPLGEIVRDDYAVSFLRQCGRALDPSSQARLSPLAAKASTELNVEVNGSLLQTCRERQGDLDRDLALSPAALLATPTMTKYVVEVTRASKEIADLVAAAE